MLSSSPLATKLTPRLPSLSLPHSFFISAFVYFVVAKSFPARETIIAEAVWDDEEDADDAEASSSDIELKKEVGGGEGLPWDGHTTSELAQTSSPQQSQQITSLH